MTKNDLLLYVYLLHGFLNSGPFVILGKSGGNFGHNDINVYSEQT